VLDAVVEGLNDVFLETGHAGISRDRSLALRVRELLIGDAEHIHLDAARPKPRHALAFRLECRTTEA